VLSDIVGEPEIYYYCHCKPRGDTTAIVYWDYCCLYCTFYTHAIKHPHSHRTYFSLLVWLWEQMVACAWSISYRA